MKEIKFFNTKEVLEKAGLSRNTLFLWLKKGKIPEVVRDRNGYRLFSPEDIKKIVKFKNKLIIPPKLIAKGYK